MVIGVDKVAARRDLAARFGVDHVFDSDDVKSIKDLCKPEGADAVIELCGDPGVIPAGIEMLRTGGRYVLGGLVNPDAFVRIDANKLLRKLITLSGVHNYHPRHLVQALDFVVANRKRFPFHELVDGKYKLEDVGQAMQDAAERKVLRAAIIP